MPLFINRHPVLIKREWVRFALESHFHLIDAKCSEGIEFRHLISQIIFIQIFREIM